MKCHAFITTVFSIVFAGSIYAQSIHDLSRLSNAKTRSISPENFTGEKGKGGMADPIKSKGQRNVANASEQARDLGLGWKVNPYININAGSTFTIAEMEGPKNKGIMNSVLHSQYVTIKQLDNLKQTTYEQISTECRRLVGADSCAGIVQR